MSKIIFSKKFKLNLKQELFESLTENRFDLKKKNSAYRHRSHGSVKIALITPY